VSERSQAAAGRTIVVTALGLLLVAVVGLASSGSPWHGASSDGSVSTDVVRAVAAGAGVLVVAALLLVWVGTPSTQRRKRQRRRLGARDLEELGASLSTAGKAAAVVAGAVGLFLLISLLFVAPKATPPVGGAAVTTTTQHSTTARRPAGHVESRSLAWLVVSAAAALVLLAPVAVAVRRRRARRERAPVLPDVAAQVGSGLRGSLEELEAERDPRLAIRRAYERMEESFGAVELVRARDETPSEYTARVLRAVGAGAAPASELTGLFELARFSDHTLGEDDRRRAIASVRQIEAELARQ
jgi:hypothetical protein